MSPVSTFVRMAVIEPGAITFRGIPNEYEHLSGLVGGSLCFVPLGAKVHGYVDDDGDRNERPVNKVGTWLFHLFNPGVADPILGTLLVAGTDGDGEANIPSPIEDLIRGGAKAHGVPVT